LKRFIILPIIFACALATAQQSVTGVVTNGTTRKPAAGDDVILLKLGQGMQEESRTKTDQQGRFTLQVAQSNTPHLIRVRHQNVNYHEPLTPGKNNLEITVYNAVSKVPEIKLLDQSFVYQPQLCSGSPNAAQPCKNILQVIEVLRVRNTSYPPVTQPQFDFYLPDGAKVERAEVVAPGGMPINNAPVPQDEKNKYSFLYPLRPGVTQFEMVYSLPYEGSAKLEPRLTLPAEKLFVVLPKSVKFSPASGSAFHPEPWALEPQMDVNSYVIDGAAPGKKVAFEIAGSGSLPQDNPQEQAQAQAGAGGPARPGETAGPGGGLGVPNERPNPLTSGQWMFLAVLVVFLGGGAVFLFTIYSGNAGKNQSAGAPLLDALKEEMFQLESDRASSKLSPKDYETAKATLDKTLQRAVKMNKRAASR
jgi:hypothetical protein